METQIRELFNRIDSELLQKNKKVHLFFVNSGKRSDKFLKGELRILQNNMKPHIFLDDLR